MVSTFTPNIQLEEPARGDDVGTWDTPVNNNMSLIDLVAGGIATIPLNNSNVTLSAAQYECKTITFNSTLTGTVLITFPTSFKKSYEVQNLCSGTSAFIIALLTTAAGGQVISAPPGEVIDVLNDGTNLKYKNLGRVGSLMEHAGSSVPNWISNCTIPPYLNCDGTAFSSATYPALTTILGGTTLPDSRGRVRATLNQGTARLNSSNGVDGTTNFAAGGVDGLTLTSSQLPASIPYTDPGHAHLIVPRGGDSNTPGTVAFAGSHDNLNLTTYNSCTATVGITINPSSLGTGATHANVQPTYIGGLTLIRAG